VSAGNKINTTTSESNCPNLVIRKELVKNVLIRINLDNLFTVFNSKDNKNVLVYPKGERQVDVYDIDDDASLRSFQAFDENINQCRYFYDPIFNRDLIISAGDNAVKVWSINNFKKLVDIEKVYKSKSEISSVLVLSHETARKNYIVVSDYSINMNPIKIYDFNGDKLRHIDVNLTVTYLTYHYDKEDKNYYLICCSGNDASCIRRYDFETGKLVKEYTKNVKDLSYTSLYIREFNKSTQIVASDSKGYITVWYYHSGVVEKLIDILKGIDIKGICQWDERIVCVGTLDNIDLIDVQEGKLLTKLKSNDGWVVNVKKFKSSVYGESLVSLSEDGKIKLWVNKTK
jgi:WD40 repeat protein